MLIKTALLFILANSFVESRREERTVEEDDVAVGEEEVEGYARVRDRWEAGGAGGGLVKGRRGRRVDKERSVEGAERNRDRLVANACARRSGRPCRREGEGGREDEPFREMMRSFPAERISSSSVIPPLRTMEPSASRGQSAALGEEDRESVV